MREPHDVALCRDADEVLPLVVPLFVLLPPLVLLARGRHPDVLRRVVRALRPRLWTFLFLAVWQRLRREPLVESVGVLVRPRAAVPLLAVAHAGGPSQAILQFNRRWLLAHQTPPLLLPPDIVAVRLPLYCTHEPLEADRADRKEYVKDLRALLVRVVDVLLAAALHPVLRVSLLTIDLVTGRALVQVVTVLQ